jgi:hypothetical protein
MFYLQFSQIFITMERNIEDRMARLLSNADKSESSDTDSTSIFPEFSAFFHPSDMVKYFKHWISNQMSPESLELFESHPEGMEKFEQQPHKLVKIYEEANSTMFLEDWRYQLRRCFDNLQHHFGSGIVFSLPPGCSKR